MRAARRAHLILLDSFVLIHLSATVVFAVDCSKILFRQLFA
jgi:hypothetical protein